MGTAQSWSKEDTEIFIESCVTEARTYFTQEGAFEYCSCTMEKIMVLYPDAIYIDLMTDEELGIVAGQCINEIMEGDKDVLLTWEENTKAAFIEGCEEELAGTGIDAKIYCPCALEEVMKQYKTPFEAESMTEEVLYEIAGKCLGE